MVGNTNFKIGVGGNANFSVCRYEYVGIANAKFRVGGLKPIFHWKLGLRWVPNANEIYTKNMKCTWPTQKICVWYPTEPIFH